MAAQPGLCLTWLETPKTSFLTSRLICVYIQMDNLHKEEEIMKRYRMDIEHLKLGRVHTFYCQQIVHKQFKHLNIQA